MVDVVAKGFTLTKMYQKQRTENAKWFLNVYKPEKARLYCSIRRLEKENANLLCRGKEITRELDRLSACWEVIYFKQSQNNDKHFRNYSETKMLSLEVHVE
jgi:hypothetical protein